MGRAFFLTGRPGVGKTTVIRAVVRRLGARAGGFYTEEVREQGHRTGFRLVAFGTGPDRVGTLAGVNVSSHCRVGKYGVHLQDLDRVGVTALRWAVEQPGVSVVVIDEIGKMELFSPAFREVVQAALASPKPMLATVMAAPHPWVDAIKARSDVFLVEVTPANRHGLPEQVLRWIDEMLEEGVSA
jgi:nucleoside-triphosphatase